MKRSTSIALILGPCLAVAGLSTVYLVRSSQSAAPGLPLDLHAIAALPSETKDVSSPQVTELAATIVAASKIPPDLAQIARQRLPTFDVVRVERHGDAVVAGHAEPNADIALLLNDAVIARGKADAAGEFVLLPALPVGEHSLALSATSPLGKVISDQHVAVSVPANPNRAEGKEEVMVALQEPGKATALLNEPAAPKDKTSAEKAKPQVAITTAEVVEPGGFFATGHAAVGTSIRIYLNGSLLIEAKAGPDGRWSVTIGKGLMPGQYAIRADQIDKKGDVVSRAEVPFDYPAPSSKTIGSDSEPHKAEKPILLAQNNPLEASALRPDKAEPQNAMVAEVQTRTVEKGNSLWRISRVALGRGERYTEIYTVNAAQIRDPSLIYPGQIFVIPGRVN
jgi:nucleoid-associated protein YgaU